MDSGSSFSYLFPSWLETAEDPESFGKGDKEKALSPFDFRALYTLFQPDALSKDKVGYRVNYLNRLVKSLCHRNPVARLSVTRLNNSYNDSICLLNCR